MRASKNKLYSETMRELSFLPEEQLKLYQMKWGLIEEDGVQIAENIEFFNAIPLATPVRINAMRQIMESLVDDFARKEWADRIEGKPTQTTVSINHSTTDGIEELENYTLEKLDDIFRGMSDE